MKYSTKSALAVVALTAVPGLASATIIGVTNGTPAPGKNVSLDFSNTEFSFDSVQLDDFNTGNGTIACDSCSLSFKITASDRDTGIGSDVSTFADLESGTYDFNVNGESYTGDIRDPSVVITTNESETESVFEGQFFATAPTTFIEQFDLAYNGDIEVNFAGTEARRTRMDSLTVESYDASGGGSPAVSDVPEPSSLAALGLGGLLMAGGFFVSRNKRREGGRDYMG